MKRTKRPKTGWLVATLAWIMWILVILLLPPVNLGVELVMVGSLAIAVFFTVTIMGKNRKVGLVITVGVVGMLALRRLGWLDLLSGGIVLIILGLITLIN